MNLYFRITPSNIYNSKLFIPLIINLLSKSFANFINGCYGDNAYDSLDNREFCRNHNIKTCFHTKAETSKKMY
ncbi:MAG: hypothetical protein ACTSRP_17030 [Candidatus Helarchaeota archaeon]